VVRQETVSRLDGRADLETGAAVVSLKAACLDRALHLQAGRRRGLHRDLPDFAG